MYSTVNRKSITERIACLHQLRESKELSRSLRESLLTDVAEDGETGWVHRGERASSATVVEYVQDGDPRKIWWTIKITPRRRCWTGCDLEVRANGGVVPMPGLLQRILLANAAKLFVLRWANRFADKTLGN